MSEGKWMEWKEEKEALRRRIQRIREILHGSLDDREREIWEEDLIHTVERYSRIPA